MPRKLPLPEQDRAIAARLREAREERLIRQTDFAMALDVTRAQLINYEEAKSRVPWWVGLRLLRKFGINPRWLVTGELPKTLPPDTHLPEPDPDELRRRRSLSQTYDEWWRPHVEAAVLKAAMFDWTPKLAPDGLQLEIIRDTARGWLERVPPDLHRDFWLQLVTTAEGIIGKLCPNDRGPRHMP